MAGKHVMFPPVGSAVAPDYPGVRKWLAEHRVDYLLVNGLRYAGPLPDYYRSHSEFQTILDRPETRELVVRCIANRRNRMPPSDGKASSDNPVAKSLH